MDMVDETAGMIQKVSRIVLSTGAKVGTMYLSDRLVVRVTRRWYKARIGVSRGRVTKVIRHASFCKRHVELTVNVGPPNYIEREFIKQCKKAGEPLPLAKIQLKFPPKR